MNNIQNLSPETDLHICSHIEQESLPAMLQPLMSLAQSPAEQDMLLLSLLTAAGSCMPNLYFRYGLTGKKYYPNLQCFIVGSAACGKGIANLALDFVRQVDEAMPLVIPGDSSYPGFYRRLLDQDGRGYIHESEGSVITDVWRSTVTSYNTALRKAAEHEPITRNRANDNSSIPCPQLSVLLTGTFSQYRALVPSTENGYFSRLLTLIVNEQQPFSSKYVEPADATNNGLPAAAAQLFLLFKQLYASRPIEFALTPDQRTRLGQHLQTAYPALISQLGSNFHSVILRMAVQIERIALILTALRMESKVESQKSKADLLVCADADYQMAEMIGNKLILHIAAAYRTIKGKEEVAVPKIETLDQRMMLLSLLPDEYESWTLVNEAKAQGVAERTAFRWNEKWQEEGVVMKIRQGHFKKSLAVA